jgi:hypothetical protein
MKQTGSIQEDTMNRGKVFMVERITNFCKSESQEKQDIDVELAGKDDQSSQNIHKEPTNKLSTADRLQRAAFEKRKSHEIHHPFKLILQDNESQNLLRIKFLDCILREAEDTVVVVNGFSDKIKSPNNSKVLKRSKRKAPLMQPNGSSSIDRRLRVVNLTWHEKSNQTTPTFKFNHPRFPRNSKSSAKISNDPHKILQQYYAKYEIDILASKQKIRDVFCNQPLNFPASNMNETWFHILESLESHLEKVTFFPNFILTLMFLFMYIFIVHIIIHENIINNPTISEGKRVGNTF